MSHTKMQCRISGTIELDPEAFKKNPICAVIDALRHGRGEMTDIYVTPASRG